MGRTAYGWRLMDSYYRSATGRYGQLIEYARTDQIFTHPRDKRTEDYITGRFG